MIEDTEEKVLFTFHSTPCFWKCYVYGTCTALHPDLIEAFHDHLNSTELCVPFTGVERAQEEREVATALNENGYPSGFIHRQSYPDRPRPSTDDPRPKSALTLPCIGALSAAIR